MKDSVYVETVPHSGAIVVSAMVTDGVGGPWRKSKTYYLYDDNTSEAVNDFREEMAEQKITIL